MKRKLQLKPTGTILVRQRRCFVVTEEDRQLAQAYLDYRATLSDEEAEQGYTFAGLGRFAQSKGRHLSLNEIQDVSRAVEVICMKRFAEAARSCARR